jgi:hypothetical protein
LSANSAKNAKQTPEERNSAFSSGGGSGVVGRDDRDRVAFFSSRRAKPPVELCQKEYEIE